MSDVTQILSQIESGQSDAAERLLPLIYDELRRLASAKMGQESPNNTLQPTALVHEAYIRLVDGGQDRNWAGRGQFFAAAAEAMRRILVERARTRTSLKRGGDWQRLDLDDVDICSTGSENEYLLALHDALEKLEHRDRLKADIVKLRYFAGFTIDETAEALGVSHATVEKHWRYAKCWLRVELTSEPDSSVSDGPPRKK